MLVRATAMRGAMVTLRRSSSCPLSWAGLSPSCFVDRGEAVSVRSPPHTQKKTDCSVGVLRGCDCPWPQKLPLCMKCVHPPPPRPPAPPLASPAADTWHENVRFFFFRLRVLALFFCTFSCQIRPKFMMDGDKMRLDLNNLEGIEMFIDRERVAAPEQPPAWKIK